MIDYIKENSQFILLMIVWTIAGILIKESALVLVPMTLILLKRKGRYTEIFLGFFFIIFLSDNRHHELDFAKLVKDITLVLLCAFVFLDRKNFSFRSGIFVPFTAFLLLALALSVRHPEPVTSFQKILSYSLLLIFIPNYFIRELTLDGRRFMQHIIWAGTILLTIGFILIIVKPDWPYLVGRYNGLLGNPNGVGTFCCLLTILVALARYHFPDIFSRNQMLLIIAVIAISVLMSRSRNGMFSILIFLFFLRFYRISYWAGLVIVIVSAIAFQLVNENLVSIVTNLGLGEFLRADQLDDGSGRTIAWAFAWQEIQKNFMLGRGFAYEEYLFVLNQEWLSMLNHQGGVHNTYLALWLNTGLVGLVLFMYGFFRNFLAKGIKNYLAVPAMFAIMFQITFEPWFQSSLNPFTSMALLVIVLLQYEKPSGEAVATGAKQEVSIPVL
jgi:O-antigen ligase